MSTHIPAVETFTFAERAALSIPLRTITQDDETLFNGADICAALGYTNVSQSLADHVDPDDKHIVSIGLPGRAPIYVTESGMYSLILRSNKPEAKVFKRWVTKEVLPTIRRQGAFVQGASKLSPEAQDAFYAALRALLVEALRRYDRQTEHVHYRSLTKQRQWSRLASEKVAEEMGLPLDVVLSAASHGIEAGLGAVARIGQ